MQRPGAAGVRLIHAAAGPDRGSEGAGHPGPQQAADTGGGAGTGVLTFISVPKALACMWLLVVHALLAAGMRPSCLLQLLTMPCAALYATALSRLQARADRSDLKPPAA